jgi:hypothetical protein
MNRMNFIAVLGGVLALRAAAPAAPPAPARPAGPPKPDIVMEDQFQHAHRSAEHRGDILVLIYGDRQSAKANRALGEWLHVEFHPAAKGQPPAQAQRAPVRPLPDAVGLRAPDVRAVPVACVGPVPALVRKIIRGQVRAGSADVPVWLDFTDQMKQLFGLKPGVPNVVVLDAAGHFRHSAAGELTAAQRTALVQAIEMLRREAAALPAAPPQPR